MFLIVLICTQNDKEKRFFSPSYGMYLFSWDEKKKFSEMLIGTKFLDKKKEWNDIISSISH